MKESNLKRSELIKFLQNYIKHPTLEVELTLKDGTKAILEHRQSIIKRSVVGFIDSVRKEIPLNEIRKADVFSI